MNKEKTTRWWVGSIFQLLVLGALLQGSAIVMVIMAQGVFPALSGVTYLTLGPIDSMTYAMTALGAAVLFYFRGDQLIKKMQE